MGRDLVGAEPSVEGEAAIGKTQGVERVLKDPVGISGESEIQSQERPSLLGRI